MKYVYPEGATPIDANESEGLIPSKLITTQAELNEYEFAAINNAIQWAYSEKRNNILTIEFIKLLHEKMFGLVWKWAGSFRKTNKNLGIEYYKIPVEVKKLCDDATFWKDNNTYLINDMAVIFHYKLVSIHPFSNGNGRHARFMADLILYNETEKKLSWGGNIFMEDKSEKRNRYIQALHDADNNDYTSLIKFANS